MPRDRQAKQVTLTEPLWEQLDELGVEFEFRDKRGVHSPLVREMVSAAVTKWRESPYVCRSARHTVLVTRDGHVFYRLLQVLKLNSSRDRLPCLLEMKPEKRQYFLHQLSRLEAEEAEWFRSRWLLNHFAVWLGHELKGPPHSSWVDREGTYTKVADLPVNQGRGRYLVREILAGIQDYVQWQEEERGDDRVDIPIDIPTRNLEVIVVVDADLYRRSSPADNDFPNLDLEFRNREGARFEGKEPALDPENSMEVSEGKQLMGRISTKAEPIVNDLRELGERLAAIAEAEAGNGAVLTVEGQEMLRQAFQRPERFLFYRLEWPSPYFGLEVCVRWEKPLRPTSLKKA